MAEKQLATAQNVLDLLGISDFRHVKKEHMIKLVSMFQDLDEETRNKIIAQLPNFTTLITDSIHEYRITYTSEIQSNDVSMKEIYHLIDRKLTMLENELKNETLSHEERCHIMDLYSETVQLAMDKDTENKEFIKEEAQNIRTYIERGIVFLFLLSAGLFGVKTLAKRV